MRRDHRPYFIKKIDFGIQKWYLGHYVRPQLESLGRNPFVVKPWHVEIFGGPVHVGSHVTLLAARDKKTRLTVWPEEPDVAGIRIGHHVLISPGVRISAAREITISDSCMIAGNAYISDSDWHGLYDRSLPSKDIRPVFLAPNVWIGDSAIICKGVTIGENSVIGAGSVVTRNIPDNVIAAGNPARVIRPLDPEQTIITRKDRFGDTDLISMNLDRQERNQLKGNTLVGWLRHLVRPAGTD